MKNKTGSIVAIVLLSLLACGLVFATYFGIKYISLGDFSNSRFFSTESQRLALEKEFDLKTIKLPYASHLKTFLSSVYNAESVYITQNRAVNGLSKY